MISRANFAKAAGGLGLAGLAAVAGDYLLDQNAPQWVQNKDLSELKEDDGVHLIETVTSGPDQSSIYVLAFTDAAEGTSAYALTVVPGDYVPSLLKSRFADYRDETGNINEILSITLANTDFNFAGGASQSLAIGQLKADCIVRGTQNADMPHDVQCYYGDDGLNSLAQYAQGKPVVNFIPPAP